MDLELKPVVAGSPDCPAEAVHGSYLRNWTSIKQQGLSCMNRTHIHLAPGLPGQDGVISGNLLLLCGHVCHPDVGWTNISTLMDFVLVSRHEERLWSGCLCWHPQSTGRYHYSFNSPLFKMLNSFDTCSNLTCSCFVILQMASSSSGQKMVFCWLQAMQRECFSPNISAER